MMIVSNDSTQRRLHLCRRRCVCQAYETLCRNAKKKPSRFSREGNYTPWLLDSSEECHVHLYVRIPNNFVKKLFQSRIEAQMITFFEFCGAPLDMFLLLRYVVLLQRRQHT